jgi:hypothetical protein
MMTIALAWNKTRCLRHLDFLDNLGMLAQVSDPIYLAPLQEARGWTGRIHLRANALFSGHWREGHLQPSRVSDDHELVCFLGGETEVQIGPQRYFVRGGEALIFPPGLVQFSRAIAPPVDRICVHFD